MSNEDEVKTAVAGTLLKNEILDVKPTRKWDQSSVDPKPNWEL